MPVRDALKLGCALGLGLALAFPAGMMVASGPQPAGRRPDMGSAERRQVYSPVITNDPFFVERQRENAAALERHCRDTGQLCAEARQTRASLERAIAGD